MYTALVLDESSQNALRNHFIDRVEDGWLVKCHHMTINMGLAEHGPAAEFIGQEVELTVVSFGKDLKVMAVEVETVIPSNNSVKHITVAINVDGGGKPKHSNELKEWQSITKLFLKGTVREVQ